VHHGYARTTEDVDVLVEAGTADRLDAQLPLYGFERATRTRLRHVATSVRVDLLIASFSSAWTKCTIWKSKPASIRPFVPSFARYRRAALEEPTPAAH
jgi:hypothetical protein